MLPCTTVESFSHSIVLPVQRDSQIGVRHLVNSIKYMATVESELFEHFDVIKCIKGVGSVSDIPVSSK